MAVADILVCALRRDPFYPLLRHCHCHFGNRFYIVIILIIFKLHFFGACIIQIELVDTAENGAEAVEKVKNSKPGNYDLVLMDVQMPVMNGYEATKQIRALDNPALAGITILAMTANAFDEDKKKALECGMDGFLSKPIVIEELISILQKNLD